LLKKEAIKISREVRKNNSANYVEQYDNIIRKTMDEIITIASLKGDTDCCIPTRLKTYNIPDTYSEELLRKHIIYILKSWGFRRIVSLIGSGLYITWDV
jgi:hypothetical protein